MRFSMHLKDSPFDSIKAGTKDIEMRLYDETRRQIKPGDIIEFLRNDDSESLLVVVLNLHVYDSFKGIYDNFDKVRLGYKEDETAHYTDMEQYYPKENINKYGVVGIEIKLLSEITPAILTDHSICPTCFNKENNNILYGDDTYTLVYEDDLIECFFVGNPRAKGHMAISSKKHYKDMMDIDDSLCDYVFKFAKSTMNIIKEVYKSESVYLCTMCDGPMNHFHLQLIPRYKEEKRGSTNFVKPRQDYVYDKEKFELIKKLLNK